MLQCHRYRTQFFLLPCLSYSPEYSKILHSYSVLQRKHSWDQSNGLWEPPSYKTDLLVNFPVKPFQGKVCLGNQSNSQISCVLNTCWVDIRGALYFHLSERQHWKVNPILGCMNKGRASRLRMCSPPLTRWHLEHCIHSLGPQDKKPPNKTTLTNWI